MPAVETQAATTTEEIWAKLKTGLLKTTEEVWAQQSPTDGDMKLGGGIRKWMMPSQPSAKLSKHGRLVNAHEHHISRRVVHHARQEADKVVYDGIVLK